MIREFVGEIWASRFFYLEVIVLFIGFIMTWSIARATERKKWHRDPEKASEILRASVRDLRKLNRIQKAYIGQLEDENQNLRDRLRGGLSRVLQGLTIMGGDHGTGTESWYQREAERLLQETSRPKATNGIAAKQKKKAAQ